MDIDANALALVAIASALSLTGTVVWSMIDRRRQRTATLVARLYGASEALMTRCLIPQPPLDRLTRGRAWLEAVAEMEGARAELLIHLGRVRWRSRRHGLRETLKTLADEILKPAGRCEETPTRDALRELAEEARLTMSVLGRWQAHRVSFWKGDISGEVRKSMNTEPCAARGPRWWRWLRPGR